MALSLTPKHIALTARELLSYHYATRRGFVFGCHGMSANLGDALAPL